MKLVVVLSRVPYPLEKGDKLRAYHQVRVLAQHHDVHLICLDDKGASQHTRKHLESIVASLHIFPLGKPGIAWQLFLGLFSSRPYQVHYFLNGRIKRKINRLIDRLAPDHIYCQLVRCAEYVKNRHDIPKTIDYMDALNAGIRRRIERSSFWMRPLLREEAKRLVRYENLIFDYFDHHTIISVQDRELIYHPERNSITVIPNGVDTDFFIPDDRQVPHYDVVFTGNMNYPPNVDGALRLIREIKPLVDRGGRRIKVLIAGANPAAELKSLEKDGEIHISGWMNDIRGAYTDAKVFVAPMRIGSGMQNKLLEAMSMEMPCVTTSLAANAFSEEQQKVLLTGDSNEELAMHITGLLDDERRRKELGEHSRILVASGFNWDSTIEHLENVLKS